MKNLITLTLFILMSFSVLAQSTLMKDKNVKAAMLEANSEIKASLTNDLKQSVGLDEFILTVKYDLNEKKLKDLLGVKDSKETSRDNFKLPGLFVEGTDEFKPQSSLQLRKEDIIQSIQKLNIEIHFRQENYSEVFLKDALKELVIFNYPDLKNIPLTIVPKKDIAPYRKKNEATPQETLIKNPLQVSINGSFSEFWNDNFKTVAIIFFSIFFLTFLLSTFYIKGGFSTISEAIKNKAMTGGASSSSAPAPKSVSESSPERKYDNQDINAFESYVQASEHLALMLEKEAKISREVILLKLMTEDFVSLTLLMDVIPQDKREIFMNNMEKERRDRFKEYILNKGSSFVQNDALLKEEAVKMIKLIKVSSLSPDDLYQIVTVDLISALRLTELEDLSDAATDKERDFLMNILSPLQVAHLIQNDLMEVEDFDSEESHDLNRDELLELMIKATSFRKHDKHKGLSAKLEDVYAQIETSKAEALGDAIGLSSSLRFENLFNRFEETAVKHLEGLDYDVLSQLYPLLTDGMQEKVLKILPELLSERLKFSKKIVTPEGLRYKGEFYFYLRSLSGNDLGYFDSKLAA